MSRVSLGDRSDKSWERLGRNDAYYGVLSTDRYRVGNLSETVVAEFMESGEGHIADILRTAEHHFGPIVRREKALDFGCGVGRLVIPLARRFGEATGIDISASMIDEARLNAKRASIENVRFCQTVDELLQKDDRYDFIHSVIVFQHIPVKTGEKIISQLATLLAPGGIAAIHVLLKLERPLWRKLFSGLRSHIALLRIPANVINGRPWNEPMMQMNEYSLDRLFLLLSAQGVQRIMLERDGSETALQAYLIFRS